MCDMSNVEEIKQQKNNGVKRHTIPIDYHSAWSKVRYLLSFKLRWLVSLTLKLDHHDSQIAGRLGTNLKEPGTRKNQDVVGRPPLFR